MQARSTAEIADIAKRWRDDRALPRYVQDLAAIVLQMVEDIERSIAPHPATLKTLNDMVECLIEEAAPYADNIQGPNIPHDV